VAVLREGAVRGDASLRRERGRQSLHMLRQVALDALRLEVRPAVVDLALLEDGFQVRRAPLAAGERRDDGQNGRGPCDPILPAGSGGGRGSRFDIRHGALLPLNSAEDNKSPGLSFAERRSPFPRIPARGGKGYG